MGPTQRCVATRIVWETVDLALNVVAFVVGLVFSIPIVGRQLGQIVDAVLNYVQWTVGLVVDWVLERFGVDSTKRLSVRIIVLRDGKGESVIAPADLEPTIGEARTIFRREANIEPDSGDVGIQRCAWTCCGDCNCEDCYCECWCNDDGECIEP